MIFLKSKKKLAVVAALITTMATGSLVYAASVVKQDAYYDTFRFLVNGNEQVITDVALKPFIANSRVYVPMATLNGLGIANAQWTPASNGVSAVLNVTPKASATDPAQIVGLQTQISNLAANVSAKDAEIRKLNEENKSLKEELQKLKDEAKKNSSTSSSTTISDTKLRDLNDSYRRNLYSTYFDSSYRVKIKDSDKYKEDSIRMEFDAKATAYRDQLDVELTSIRRIDSDKWMEYIKSDNFSEYDMRRFLDRNIVEPATREFRDIRDLRINITVYNGDRRNGTRIVTGTYDRDRLEIRVN